MKSSLSVFAISTFILLLPCSAANAGQATTVVDQDGQKITLQAGHSSLKKWLLPTPPAPADNPLTPERIALGKKLFFDTRLSGDGNMSCATCHNPLYGWSDGLPTAKGFKSQVLGRASPTVANSAYGTIFMWDGRKKSLEDQAMGPMEATAEMNMNLDMLFKFLSTNQEYQTLFKRAYPGLGVNADSVSKAIASFERTIISNDSPFDHWIKGDKKAMTPEQIKGFALFVDPNKGNCAACHAPPNFTDNGFHNIGLASFGIENPDLGRYLQRPVALMKGAFKTPTLRDISYTAPYFHDGSAQTLADVIDMYVKGGEVKTNLSPNLKPLTLNDEEKKQLQAFLQALASPQKPLTLPILPH